MEQQQLLREQPKSRNMQPCCTPGGTKERRPTSSRQPLHPSQKEAGVCTLPRVCPSQLTLSSARRAGLTQDSRQPLPKSAHSLLLNQAKRNMQKDENIFTAVLLSTELQHRLITDLHFGTAGN